jgi:transcription elongation factor Elf1
MTLRPNGSRKVAPRPLVECAQCGDRLYVPEWSELVDERRMRHLWTCDSCGYQFETTVRFREAIAA